MGLLGCYRLPQTSIFDDKYSNVEASFDISVFLNINDRQKIPISCGWNQEK